MGRSAKCPIPRLSSVQRPERDILLDSGTEQLIVRVLKHDADLSVQPLLAGSGIIHRAAKHGQFALTRPQGAVDEQHERRFADTVGAQQSDPSGRAEREAHLVNGRLGVTRGAVSETDVSCFQNRSHKAPL
jgi:hypothetical protein